MRGLLLLLLYPIVSFAWTVNDRCELIGESSEGPVAFSEMTGGLLLSFPEGFVANDAQLKVGIGSHSWRVIVVGGAVELRGGVQPFLEGTWLQAHTDEGGMLGVRLKGSADAWRRLESCEPPDRGGWLTLSGEIRASSDDEIIAAIRRQRPEGLVLDSAGGLPTEAQRIGFAVRAGGLATRVPVGGQCLSECTFVLAAGVSRSADRDARVGVPPSFFTKGLGVLGAEEGSVLDNATYFRAMGLDGGRLAVLVSSTRGEEIHIFTPAELGELGLADVDPPAETEGSESMVGTNLESDGWLWLLALFAGGAFLWNVARNWVRS